MYVHSVTCSSCSHLRDGVLSEGQILNQNIQPAILLIKKLPDPPTEKESQVRETDNNVLTIINIMVQAASRSIRWYSDRQVPDVVCAKRNLEFSEHLG